MPLKNTPDDPGFFETLIQRLREVYTTGADWHPPGDVRRQLALLEEVAIHNRRFYSIFDFRKFDYLYYTRNLAALAGEPLLSHQETKWQEAYMEMVQEKHAIRDFINVRQKVTQMLDPGERNLLKSSVCGGTLLNFQNHLMRMHFHSQPIQFDGEGNVVVSFDSLEDIRPLLDSQPGYWMRFSAGTKVFHWCSDEKILYQKDIVSSREKKLIELWKAGHSVSAIAELAFISVQTVKNQLQNARKRTMVRDNTALAHICTLTGAVDPSF